jgi:hypothetical protein
MTSRTGLHSSSLNTARPMHVAQLYFADSSSPQLFQRERFEGAARQIAPREVTLLTNLLLNFNVPLLSEGIVRRVLGLNE